MQGLAAAVQYFYERWILRDVLGYVTPGAVLLAVILGQLIGWKELAKSIADLPALAFLPLFGLLFITGFALQNIGEGLGLLRWHDRPSDEEHLRALFRFHAENLAYEKSPGPGAGGWTERTRERISVKKNMSGTALLALIVSALFTLVYQGARWLGLPAVGQAWVALALVTLVVLLLGWGLLRGHRRQHQNQTLWENISREAAAARPAKGVSSFE